jgi:hypothetical protein
MTNNKHLLQNIAIICFILIALSNIIAFLHPAKGYELSIYESTPTFVWIFLIFSIIGGVTIIVHQVYTKAYKNSNFWLFGFLILILSRVSLLYIPSIRGFYTWRGDNLSHIGYVKDVLLTGHFPTDSFYPVTHILLAELISISGAPIELIVNLSTALFSVLYVVSIYLVATTVLPERGQQLLVFALIGGVFFNDFEVFLRPNGWSFLMLPLVLFLYFKHSINYQILFVIFLILYPFFHPFSSIVLVALFIAIGLSQTTLGYIYKIKHKKRELFPIVPILIVLCILIPWTLSFQFLGNILRRLFEALTTGYSPDVIASMGSTLDKIQVHGFEFIKLFIKLYGDDFIFIMFSLIAGIIIVKGILSKRFENSDDIKNLVSLLVIFLIAGFLYSAYLFGTIPGLYAIGGGRFQRFLVLFTPVLAGFAIYEISKKVHSTRLIIIGIVCIIVLASAISIGSLYRSPYVLRPSMAVTQMDMHGFEWFVDYKNRDIGCTCIMSPPYRFADAILGTTEEDKRTDIERWAPAIPDHFNYAVHDKLGKSYKKDRYAAITQMDKTIYDTVWKVVGRFNESDFCRLEEDPTVDQLYDNRETEVFYIHAIKKLVKP